MGLGLIEISTNTFNELLEEYFDLRFLLQEDQSKYHLIGKYINKVSPRLFKERIALRESVRGEFKRELAEQIKRPNPFLASIKKDRDEKPWGGYLVVPFQEKKND